jgi:CheY-like chemotaxis protein
MLTPPSSVCLVDDSADYRFLVQMVLKRQLPQCYLHPFADGQALVVALPGLPQVPDLILLDQHMPVWSGHQTLMALKQHPVYRSIPVVMMSADATYSEVTGFYQAGATAFLPKSLDLDGLQEGLLVACQHSRA